MKYNVFYGIYMLLLLQAVMVHGQLQVVNTPLSVEKNGLLFVSGDIDYRGGGIRNNGAIGLTGNWSNNDVTGNRVFDAVSTGEVDMMGAAQAINGNTTVFPQLVLSGKGVKTMNTTMEIAGFLHLRDGELDQNGYDLLVNNDAADAITFNKGLINNTGSNHIARVMQQVKSGSSYFYPLGGVNGGVYRYRPVVLAPAGEGQLAVQFRNDNPGNDFYWTDKKDMTLKTVNDRYYHTVELTGGSIDSVTSYIYYNPATDGSFDTVAVWSQGTGQWTALREGRIADNPSPGDEHLDKVAVFNLSGENKQVIALGKAGEVLQALRIPNVFTPNGDGLNETFYIRGLENYRDNELIIVNRWGNQVYRRQGYSNDWNGNGLHEGTYYYLLKVRDGNGRERRLTGFVLIKR